jgi:molybdate transport system permease protein
LWLFGLIATLFFLLPFLALLWQTPWSELDTLLRRPMVAQALRLSVISSFAAALISTIFGVPLAWLLARSVFPGRTLVRALVTMPLVLPPVVGGVALLFAFGRRGVVGEALYESTGVVLPNSIWAVILANVFVAMPFLVVTIEAAFANMDGRLELAASTLGASSWRVFWRVTLPSIVPSLVAGMALAWARALGEFGATITFAGNLSGRTQTLPLAVFVAMESDRDLAVALSLILMVIALAVLVALRGHWWAR